MRNTRGSNSFRIMIADDDSDDIQLTKDCFAENKLAANFEDVIDGQYLIDNLKNKLASNIFAGLPHLILLDLNMPRKGGFEALIEIKADDKLNKIPVVIFSTSKSNKDIEKAYQLGANCFVSKPNTLDEWYHKIGLLGRFWMDCVHVVNP